MSQKINNASKKGKVSYGKNVVLSVVALAVKEISGVASLHGKGVRTETVGKTINVDVFVNLIIGSSVSDVAFRVQENIKRSVESMTEYKVGKVNFNVLGVVLGSEAEAEFSVS